MLSAEARRALRGALVVTRALTLAAAAVVLVGGGCGDGEEPGAGQSPADETADLTFTLDADGPGGEPARNRRLVCAPKADAQHRGCDAVAALPEDPAAPTPPQTACTEIYGGPDELAVTGELRGEPIDAAFTRANGCEIDRFDRWTDVLEDLFPGYEPGASLRP